MKRSLSEEALRPLEVAIESAWRDFSESYPGESGRRQPVHTVYGGAHIFRAGTALRLGELAVAFMDEHLPDFVALARALDLPGAGRLPGAPGRGAALAERLRRDPLARTEDPAASFAHTVYSRVRDKLVREPVEDFRIDFEDGYGTRPDAEEDQAAVAAAAEVARGMVDGSLPPFIGIRIKPLTGELHRRGFRTLDLFLTALLDDTGNALPRGFVVTLPKVVVPEQVSALADAFESIEGERGLPRGSLHMELMVETTQSIVGPDGSARLPALVRAGRGRCLAAHFGVYDYTAAYSIVAEHQRMSHPSCDFARHMMKVALAGTGVTLSDGATNVVPVPPHRQVEGGPPLTAAQLAENRDSVVRAMKLHFDDVRHSLENAFYQGWDLHPAHLVTRYAALYTFFLEGLDQASERLRNFVDRAARATLAGNVFDDAATGQGLLNFFLRGVSCGAITPEEATRTGLSMEELATRSFAAILEGRRG